MFQIGAGWDGFIVAGIYNIYVFFFFLIYILVFFGKVRGVCSGRNGG